MNQKMMAAPFQSNRLAGWPLQYRLRTLLVVVLVAALLCAGFRETIGTVEREGGIGSGSTPTICFTVSNPQEALVLEQGFDREAFLSIVEERFDAASTDVPLGDVEVYIGRFDGGLWIKYDFRRWGRRRFEITRMRYTFELNDPLARQRNLAISAAVLKAGLEWARDKPAVNGIQHRW